jgi:putative membrane protein
MFWLIALVAAIMLWTESGLKRFWGLAIFTLSGILGLLSLNSPLMPSQWILFPIFTGLFGMPTLELAKSEKVPKQTMLCVSLDKISAIFGTLKGWLSGMIVGILPGIGPAQAAAVVQETTKRRNIREFLIAIGGITTVSTFFSLLALYLINKPRSGAAIALQHIIGNFGFREMAILLMTTLFVTGISVFVTLKLTKIFAQFIQKVNYKKLNLTIILLLIILVLLLTGPIGLFIMAVANAIGIIAPLVGTKRTHAMGVLMLPIMFFYFPL